MAIARLKNSKIAGICCALPDNRLSVYDIGTQYFERSDIEKVVKSVGLEYIYKAKTNQTTSDLALDACNNLIDGIGWDRNVIDGLILVTQTPDYILPSTANILQDKLKLPKGCVPLQVNLGCSGYVYGLWLASELISNNTYRKVIVVAGDTMSKTTSNKDKSVMMISDCVSATAVEYVEGCDESIYSLYSDGSGAENLIIKDGGFRNPVSENSYVLIEDEDGNCRTNMNLFMDGMAIFLFAIGEVSETLNKFISDFNINIDDVDGILFHQANRYLISMLAKNANIPLNKVPINIEKFGNTSGASIPLLICDTLRNDLKKKDLNVVMAGFGVGLSWGFAKLLLYRGIYTDIIFV